MILQKEELTTDISRMLILGSGSISFELIRNLTERLPLMITPKWVRVKAQPIGIRDVLMYLKEGLSIHHSDHRVYEIGGMDQVSYAEIMKEYAKQRGLKRLIIPVPILTPYISSLWLSIFTPIYSNIGRKLIDGIKIPTIVTQQEKTLSDFSIRPMSMANAIALAIQKDDMHMKRTHWASSFSSSNPNCDKFSSNKKNLLSYSRKVDITKSQHESFQFIQQIGGNNGWYFANYIWKIRGLIDALAGGPGYRRGRRDPKELHEGDFLDWWRVEKFTPPSCLRLAAEMKVPGFAWLEFKIHSEPNQYSTLQLSAYFLPSSWIGSMYWYILYPIHLIIFNGMTRNIKKAIEEV